MVRKKISIERGQRLRSFRERAGLTRLEFSQKTGVSVNTLKSLELGDRELSSQKTLLFSNLFALMGIDVSFDFLFYGKEQKDSLLIDSDTYLNDEDLNIQNEIDFFKKTNPSFLLLKISDRLMSPFFNEGDIVGGRKIKHREQFPLFHGYVCILETLEGDKRLRRVIKCQQQSIICCIFNTENNSPIFEEIEVISVAQATRHWRLSEVIRNIHAE